MEPSEMPVFQPDEEVIQRIVRVIEDVLQPVSDPTDFIEQSDSVEPKTAVIVTMDMESTVTLDQTAGVDPTMAGDQCADVDMTMAGDQVANVDTTVAVDTTMAMESTVTVDQTAAGDEMTDMDTTVTGDPTVDMKSTVNVDQTAAGDEMTNMDTTVAGDPTVDMKSTVNVDQTKADVAPNTSSDPTVIEDFSASADPTTVLNPDQSQCTFKQECKLIVRRLFAIECNPLQNYLMIIMKRSSIDEKTRLMSGWLLNHYLNYYYEGIPSAVISFLRTECLTSIGDISPTVRDCNCSLIMNLALKGLCKWPEILPTITEMLDSEEYSMYKGALDVLQMISNKFNLKDFPNSPIDILIPKLITLFGRTSLTKRSMSVSIVKEIVVRKTLGLLNHITALIENLLDLDIKHTQNMNDDNNKTLFRKDVCTSITALVESGGLQIDDNIHKILRYMIDNTKDNDDKIVKEACKFWITISKEQPDVNRTIVFPYMYDIISSLTDKLMNTQEDLISIKNSHGSIDYPFFTNSNSIRKDCVYAIDSMAIAFKEGVLPGAVQIINKKVSDTDLKIQEVAIVLLGCIAKSRECREAITPYLETPFNNLILLNNYFIPGEFLFRDKLLWTLVAYRDYIVDQPQYMKPLMTYMLRSEIKCPLQYPFLEGESFWNLVTDTHLSKDSFRPYLTNVLSIIFNGLYDYELTSDEVDKHDKSTDQSIRNNSVNAITNLIRIYKADILPIIMPMIDEHIASDDPRSKESGIVALGLIAKEGVGDMVTELPKYLAFMVDTLMEYNPRLSVASCLSLGRFHDWIVNRSSHDKFFVPLMQYLLTTETEYIPSDPHNLSCVLLTLEFLLLDKPNSKELFAPYLTRIVTNICKAIVYSDTDIISLQGDDEIDEYHLDNPMIVCKRLKFYLRDKKVDKTPQYKCSSESCNRGRAAKILNDITTIYKYSILPIIMPIIQAALKSDNWTVMESGIFALGVINRDKLMDNAFTTIEWFPYFKEFLQCMMDNLSSRRPIIRANVMVTLSRYSFYIVNNSNKKYLLPLMRMISARGLDTNQNVRSTALQVWNILQHEVTDDDPVIKWNMDNIQKRLMELVESYQRLQRGQDYV